MPHFLTDDQAYGAPLPPALPAASPPPSVPPYAAGVDAGSTPNPTYSTPAVLTLPPTPVFYPMPPYAAGVDVATTPNPTYSTPAVLTLPDVTLPPAAGSPDYPPEDAADWPDPEEGDGSFTEDDLRALSVEADAIDAGEPLLLSVTHPAPGTIIGTPYAGTHAKAFNVAGGSDNWESENAVDIWLYPGTRILAVEDGIVSPGQWGFGLSATGGRFAGWRLHLVASGGKVFYYTHMVVLVVRPGDRVKKGDWLGSSGVANGVPHLHFAVNPPFTPAAWAKATYDLHARTSVGTNPATGEPADAATQPGRAGINAQWRELLTFFDTGVKSERERVKALGESLKGAVS